MTTFPNSPKPLKGGIGLGDQNTATAQRIIAMQCEPGNPTTSTLQVSGAGGGIKSISFKKNVKND